MIPKKVVTAIVSLSFTLSFEARAADQTVDFQLRRGHLIVMKVSVAGTPLNAIIDTGANTSALDKRVAAKLGLEQLSSTSVNFPGQTSNVGRVIVPDLEVGPIRRDRVFVVADLSLWKVDAIIGLDVLRQHSVLTIDFEQRTITFDQVGTLSSSMSFISPHWLVIVPVLIGNHEVRLSVDTGAAYTTLKQEQIQSWGGIRRKRQSRVMHSVAGASRVSEVHLGDVQLGPTLWKGLSAVAIDDFLSPILEKDGLLSVTALKLKRIQFDFRRSILSWEK